MCKSEEEALLHWTEYFSTALNYPPVHPSSDLDRAAAGDTDSNHIPVDVSDEVCAAIGKLKDGCSPGADGITPELLKYFATTSAQLLVKLL